MIFKQAIQGHIQQATLRHQIALDLELGQKKKKFTAELRRRTATEVLLQIVPGTEVLEFFHLRCDAYDYWPSTKYYRNLKTGEVRILNIQDLAIKMLSEQGYEIN